jgi:D-alanyl-D-alanine carboxypeptidase
MNKVNRRILPIIILLLTQNAFGQTLARFIENHARTRDFSGTVAIRQKGKLAYAGRFGFADRRFKIPHRSDTKYKVASVTKAFTAVLILRLFEQGKIELHKTIKTYLPGYPGEAGGLVTIHQLLNHTAGLANLDRNLTSAESAVKNGMPHYQTPLTTDELLTRYCSERLVNEPGKVFDYNNADYIILGKIVERVSGKSFEQALRENILAPLKMNDSGMLYQHQILENLADTYFFRADLKQLANDLPVFVENWYAAGAMYSTADDLLKFADALFGSRLLRPETLNLMLKPGLDEYGYGVWVYETEIENKKYTIVKRPGRIMGAQSMVFHILKEDTTIIILSNTDAADLDEFAAKISKRIMTDPASKNRPRL